MATILSKYSEIDELGGGKNRAIFNTAPICHPYQGGWRRNNGVFVDSGITGRPHLVTLAPFDLSIDDEGDRRIHPTKDPNVFLEVGTPYVRIGGVWQKVGFASATRTANSITWSRSQADLSIIHAGHYIKLGIELKGGYVPANNQIAFPFTLQGLTRIGAELYANSKPVMHIRPPHVEDLANPRTPKRLITWDVVKLSGQNYILLTLPSLAGMTRPYIDPTFTDGYGGDVNTAKDNGISSGLPNTNFGIAAGIAIGASGGERGLYQFDLSSLTGTCDDAMFYLTQQQNFSANEISVYSISAANGGWPEGTHDFQDAGAGDSSWNNKDAGGPTAWAGSAGLSTAGTDYNSTAIGTISIPSEANTYKEYSAALTASVVETWFGASNSNYGILCVGTNGGYPIYPTSDHATTAYRPRLVVNYTAGGATGNPWYYYAQQ